MGILAWIILGGVAGWLASMVAGTNQSMGIFLNVVVGIIGAAIGGFVYGLFGSEGVTGFDFRSLIVAFVGAVILLGIARLFSK